MIARRNIIPMCPREQRILDQLRQRGDFARYYSQTASGAACPASVQHAQPLEAGRRIGGRG